MFDEVTQDLRYSIRALCASPNLAAAAILSLALGIGANTAIFSLIDAVMLRSLPASHPEELLEVRMGYRHLSNPIWEQLRDHQDVFSGIFAYGRWSFNLANGGGAPGEWALRIRAILRHAGRARRAWPHADSGRRQARLSRSRGIELWLLAA